MLTRKGSRLTRTRGLGPFKVALIGAHGTGKTTLANRALADLTNMLGNVSVALCPEIPRIICTAVGDSEYLRRENNSLEKQLTLLIGQESYEAVLQAQNDVLICDRSVLDHWAYTLNLFGSTMQRGIRETIGLFVRLHMSTYDRVGYVPIEFAPADDGTREADGDFQNKVDEIIVELLAEHEIPYETYRGSVDSRTQKLCAGISALFRTPA